MKCHCMKSLSVHFAFKFKKHNTTLCENCKYKILRGKKIQMLNKNTKFVQKSSKKLP